MGTHPSETEEFEKRLEASSVLPEGLPESLEDSMCLAGLFDLDTPLSEALAVLNRMLASDVESEKQASRAETDALLEDLTRLNQLYDSRAQERCGLSEQLELIRLSRKEHRENRRAWRARLEERVRVLRASRHTFGARLSERQAEETQRLSEQLADRLLSEQQRRLEHDKDLQRIAIERWKLNEPENNRRANYIRKNLATAEKRLRTLEGKLDILRDRGMTRTMSGFLVWGGYLGFTALGWMLGRSLQLLHTGPPDIFQLAFISLASTVSQLVQRGPLGVIQALLMSFALPAVVVLMVGGIAWLSARLGRETVHKNDRKNRESPSRGWFGSWLRTDPTSLFRVKPATVLAALPMLYVWLLIPSLLALWVGFGGRSLQTHQIENPAASLMYTYVGVTVAVVLGTFISTWMIQTRLEDRKHLPGVIFVVLLLIIVAAPDTMMVTVGSAGNLWSRERTGLVLGFMLLNSLAVAYGLFYKGQFKDHAALIRDLNRWEDRLHKYSSIPTVDIDFSGGEDFRREMRQLRESIIRRWSNLENTFFPTEPTKFRYRYWRRAKPAESNTEVPYTAKDEIIEPEIVAGIQQALEEANAAQQVSDEIDSQFDDVVARINVADPDIIRDQIQVVRKRIVDRRAHEASRVSWLEHYYLAERVRVMVAYRTGSTIRQQTEGV